ncbi:MAG: GNAT family N-acetyltransferase [Nocardioidaceae bacterium]
MAPLEIRLAQPEEYAAVGDLSVEAYVADGFLETSESYADNLRDAASRAADAELWVAADDSSVLGSVTYCPPGSRYCEVATGPDQGEFRMLAVAPRARRGGVGRALVEHCIARSRTLGHRELVMSSSASMTAAHRVYAALGFVPAPELDWSPLPRLELLGFRLTLVRVIRRRRRGRTRLAHPAPDSPTNRGIMSHSPRQRPGSTESAQEPLPIHDDPGDLAVADDRTVGVLGDDLEAEQPAVDM